MSELNSCPICGCSVRVWAKRFDEEDMEYIIECDNDFCGLTYGISCGYNREEIKKAWNNVTALSSTVNENCVSVVRCKDCKHRQEDVGMGDHCWCDIANGSRHSDDFCSYGERKNNE